MVITSDVERFYKCNHNEVIAFLRSCGIKDKEDLADISQTFYCDLHNILRNYDPNRSSISWYVCSILRKMIYNHQQSQLPIPPEYSPPITTTSMDTKIYITDFVAYCRAHGARSTARILDEIHNRLIDTTCCDTLHRTYYRIVNSFLLQDAL